VTQSELPIPAHTATQHGDGDSNVATLADGRSVTAPGSALVILRFTGSSVPIRCPGNSPSRSGLQVSERWLPQSTDYCAAAYTAWHHVMLFPPNSATASQTRACTKHIRNTVSPRPVPALVGDHTMSCICKTMQLLVGQLLVSKSRDPSKPLVVRRPLCPKCLIQRFNGAGVQRSAGGRGTVQLHTLPTFGVSGGTCVAACSFCRVGPRGV
jgi:hypothetical protein